MLYTSVSQATLAELKDPEFQEWIHSLSVSHIVNDVYANTYTFDGKGDFLCVTSEASKAADCQKEYGGFCLPGSTHRMFSLLAEALGGIKVCSAISLVSVIMANKPETEKLRIQYQARYTEHVDDAIFQAFLCAFRYQKKILSNMGECS